MFDWLEKKPKKIDYFPWPEAYLQSSQISMMELF